MSPFAHFGDLRRLLLGDGRLLARVICSKPENFSFKVPVRPESPLPAHAFQTLSISGPVIAHARPMDSMFSLKVSPAQTEFCSRLGLIYRVSMPREMSNQYWAESPNLWVISRFDKASKSAPVRETPGISFADVATIPPGPF